MLVVLLVVLLVVVLLVVVRLVVEHLAQWRFRVVHQVEPQAVGQLEPREALLGQLVVQLGQQVGALRVVALQVEVRLGVEQKVPKVKPEVLLEVLLVA